VTSQIFRPATRPGKKYVQQRPARPSFPSRRSPGIANLLQGLTLLQAMSINPKRDRSVDAKVTVTQPS